MIPWEKKMRAWNWIKKDKKIRSSQQIIKNIMGKKINYTKRSKIKK